MNDPQVRKVKQILNVHDGDTYNFLVTLGADTYREVAIRVAGIDTAELSQPDGEKARAAAVSILMNAREIHVRFYTTRTGKALQTFARYVADVDVDGEDIRKHLDNKIPSIFHLMRETYIKRATAADAAVPRG
jgi:endonuclease YncB( thermonuclease family)